MSTIKSTTVTEAVKRYLKNEHSRGLSYHHLRTITGHLKLFEKAFRAKTLLSITQDDAASYINLRGSPRSRKNHLTTLRGFCKWAQDADYIPYDRKTFSERVKSPKVTLGEPEFFTPDEMRRLLLGVSKLPKDLEWVLALVILGAFVGMRVSEICRLKWEDILLEHKSIRISQLITKTQRRRIAMISDNAMLWLSTMSDREGFIVPQKIVPNINRFTSMLTIETGVTWKNNGLRHSYVTYAMARERSAWQVAEQVGNSPSILQVHYKGLVLASDAEEWFNITPNNTL